MHPTWAEHSENQILSKNHLRSSGADLYLEQQLDGFLNLGFYEGNEINKSWMSELIQERMLKGILKICISIYYKI